MSTYLDFYVFQAQDVVMSVKSTSFIGCSPLVLLALFLAQALSSCAPKTYYYCDRPPEAEAWTFSQIVTIGGTAPQRTLSNDFEPWEFYRSYDRERDIISVYKNNDPSWSQYNIYKLDFSSTPPRFWFGYGGHFTTRQFEEVYKVPFEKKHIVNPALVKFLPPKEQGQVSRAWFDKRLIQNCENIGVVDYKVRYFLRFLTQFIPTA